MPESALGGQALAAAANQGIKMQSDRILTTEGMTPTVFSFRQVSGPAEQSGHGFVAPVELEALMGSKVELAFPDFAEAADAGGIGQNDFGLVSQSAFAAFASYTSFGLDSFSHSWGQNHRPYEAPFIL